MGVRKITGMVSECYRNFQFGLALKPELYEKYNPIPSRKDAEEIEEWLAEDLRKQGYTVWFG